MFIGQGQDRQPKHPSFPSQTTWLGLYLSALPASSTPCAAHFLCHSEATETRSPISRPLYIALPPQTAARFSSSSGQTRYHLNCTHISQLRHFVSVGNQMERESTGNIISHASHVYRIKPCIITDFKKATEQLYLVPKRCKILQTAFHNS